MKANKYIGGNFSSVDLNNFILNKDESELNEVFPANLNNLIRVFLETGTDALASIINEIICKERKYIVWYPDNYCQETINRLLLKCDTIIIKKYNSVSFLLSNKISSNIIILNHFNNYDNNIADSVKLLKGLHGNVLIEDFVHCPFDIRSFTGDYAFNSLRKVMNVEAAVAYKNQGIVCEPIDSKYVSTKKEAAKLKTVFFETGNLELEKSFLKLFIDAEKHLKSKSIQCASKSQLDKLQTINFNKIKLFRKQNFAHLNEKLIGIRGIEVLNGDYMFLMISCKNRDDLRKYLMDQNIFAPIHWLDSHTEISKRILSLPIDQRYSFQDMDRIALAVKTYYIQN